MKAPFILVLIMVLSCVLRAETPEEAIREVLHQQADAWNRGDIPGYMEGYWKSDSLVFTSGGTVNRGWEATFKKYSGKYDTPEKMGTLKFSDVEVTLVSENSAWVLGTWELVRHSDRPHGIFTLVMKNFHDGWKIIHDHTSLKSE